VVESLNANNSRTTQVYDAAGRRVALVDANGHRRSFVLDADGRQTQLVDALRHRTTYGFDAASRETLRIDARGFRTSYVYDNDDRLTGQRYPDGTRVTFAYDKASRRTLLNDGTGRTTSTFDPAGRLSAVVNPAGLRLTYAYDAASRRKYLIEPEGARFTYVFDPVGRTSYVANPQAQRATWSYDAASRVMGIQFANTTRTSYSYDNASRLLRVANLTSSNTTLSSFTYALDAVGNRLHVVESTGNRVTWTYDKTYQLKNEQRSGSNGYNITYTYDPVGNRLTEINGGARTTSTYDAVNELTRTRVVAGITTYTSDASGNLLTSRNPSNQRTTNTWDYESRLTRVLLPSGVPNTLVYNGDGQRVQKQDSTGTTKHVWDGENILLETDGSNIIQVLYTLEPVFYGNLISQRRSGTTSFYLFDGVGSTAQLVGSTGSVSDSYVYDSFGNILLTSGSTTNWFRYIGRLGYYYDLDLMAYFLRARNYYPALGRFVSRDPLAVRTSPEADVSNSYPYARNSPVILADPQGLDDTPIIHIWPPPLPPFRKPPPPVQPPVLSWNPIQFEYGRYCGLNRNGPGPPIDCFDNACAKHDYCLAYPSMAVYDLTLGLCKCQRDFCRDIRNAESKCCDLNHGPNTPGSALCKRAAGMVGRLFCLAGASPWPPSRA
jgi:RHS repeat-associated protein